MPLTMSDIREVFFDSAAGRTQDAVHPITGSGLWSGLTQQQLEERDGTALERLPIDEAVERQRLADRVRYCRAPVPITPDRADHLLNVLPPYRWQRDLAWEVFAVSEPLTSELLTWCCRIGRQWFELNEDRAITVDQLLALCRATTTATQDQP